MEENEVEKQEKPKLTSSGNEWGKTFGVISDLISVLNEDFSRVKGNP